MSKRGAPATCLVGLSFFTFSTALDAQEVLNLGNEFQVNARTSGQQFNAAVALDGDGDFVVAWVDLQETGPISDVFARRYSSSGTPLAAAFLVNSYTAGLQATPAVARDDSGDFVIVWPSEGRDGDGLGIFGRRFDASGVPQGAEFQVNMRTVGDQIRTRIDLDADGDFVVVWESDQDGSGSGAFGQRFAANGTRIAAEFQVNTYTVGYQGVPTVAVDADGDFVVAWDSFTQDGSGYGIFFRRFNSAGIAGPATLANSYTLGNQRLPQVAIDTNGDFVVAWGGYGGQDGSDTGLFAQRFNALGAPEGTEFQVNSYTMGHQYYPSIAGDNDGDFVVAWHSTGGQDGSGDGVFARLFAADGAPRGGELRANSYVTGDQTSPEVAMEGDGDFVIAWQSDGQDGDLNGVFAQRFTPLAVLDIDGNGDVAPLSDGLLVLRFLFGFNGTTLTAGAVGGGCTRCNAAAIEPYLQGLV